MMHVPKISTQKKQFISILHDEKYCFNIVHKTVQQL